MPTCLTLELKLDAVVVRHAHYKVDLQCGQGRVCSHYTSNGVTCLLYRPRCGLSDQISMHPRCVRMHSHLYLQLPTCDHITKVCHAKCELFPVDDVIMLVTPCGVSGCGHSHTWEGPSRGENEGLSRERLWVGRG